VVYFRDSELLSEFQKYKATNPTYDLTSAKGAYLRLEIPAIEQEDDYVLYTDTDVIFNSIDGLETIRPRILAIAPEFDPQDWINRNTGVMVVNVPALRSHLNPLRNFILEHLPDLSAHDQTAICRFFQGQWDQLPLEYNWKPYWGYSCSARIVHWHGPKPFHVEMILRGAIDNVPEIYNFLFNRNPLAYERYVQLARQILRENSLPEDWDPQHYLSLYGITSAFTLIRAGSRWIRE
jgi:lipopolysaccharide biosynthesis glycosyltransferase